MSPRITAIVPSLGLSRWLVPCLEALRRAGGEEIEILLVAQGAAVHPEACFATAAEIADRTLKLPANAGFAAANNHALSQARGEFLATVNDDALVDDDWCRLLVEVLERSPKTAAVQGVNLMLEPAKEGPLADGCGLSWNRYWQAIQIGHGEPAPEATAAPVEIFGVSATAAIYRREALAAVSGPDLGAFDAELFAFYEDVDLACRLRAAGYRALLVPAARAQHAGSVSARQLAFGGRQLIYGNRYLVLARLLGRAFWPRLPLVWLRDGVDLGHALRRGRLRQGTAIAAGWWRALRRLRRFAHGGPPAVPLAELLRTQRATRR